MHVVEKIQKEGKLIPYDLTEMENHQRELPLKKYEEKSFLYRIVTDDEKWIYFENPKRK